MKGQEDFAGSDGDGVEQDGKKVQQPQLLREPGARNKAAIPVDAVIATLHT